MITEVRALQPLKALLPILVTLLGIVTEVRAEQPEKVFSPILVTLLEMVIEVREVQPSYLQLIVCQLILIKTVEK